MLFGSISRQGAKGRQEHAKEADVRPLKLKACSEALHLDHRTAHCRQGCQRRIDNRRGDGCTRGFSRACPLPFLNPFTRNKAA
jgi:hypothetical protein